MGPIWLSNVGPDGRLSRLWDQSSKEDFSIYIGWIRLRSTRSHILYMI